MLNRDEFVKIGIITSILTGGLAFLIVGSYTRFAKLEDAIYLGIIIGIAGGIGAIIFSGIISMFFTENNNEVKQ